jgi:hypothetical protein
MCQGPSTWRLDLIFGSRFVHSTRDLSSPFISLSVDKMLSLPQILGILFCWIFIRPSASLSSSDTLQWEHFYLTQINISSSSYETLVNTSIHLFPFLSSSSPSTPSHYPLCVYDSIQIGWNTSRINPSSVNLAFIVDREWDGYSTHLSLTAPPNTTIPMNPIQCELNEEHCVLNIKEVFVKDKKLYLEFDKPTNQVELLSTSRLNVSMSDSSKFRLTYPRKLCRCIRPS